MCGLLTFISADGRAAQLRDPIAEALESIHHRGPDETGVHLLDSDVVCCLKRLAIIDVEHSQQPMWYADDRYVITFNGQVYNYKELRAELIRDHDAKFATEGDTEVVLAAYHHWGDAAVTRLRGMFAFVIWDRVERRAFGARDPFGIKPLFYQLTADGLILASEKKALLPFVELARRTDQQSVPAARVGDAGIDPVSLAHYLTLQYVPEPWTMHRGVQRIENGHAFSYRPGGELELTEYFHATFTPKPVSDREALYRRIRETLRESVRIHMRSDVPVGAFLSSGIDSTAVVALAREFHPNILTFTMGFDIPGYNELEMAQEAAGQLGVTSIGTKIGAREMMEQLPRIVWHLDDPVADPALVPLYFVAKKASEYVTVALSGEGSDEFFGGYGIYREPISLRPLTVLPGPVQRGLRQLARVIPEGVKGRSFLERGTTPIEARHYGNARMFTEEEKASLMRRYDPAVRYTDVTSMLYERTTALDDVTRMQYVDIYTWLRGDILVKADRMSMAHSLEVRVPFLDREVFAVAAGIPANLRVPQFSRLRKFALRQALRGVVPPQVVTMPKLGFPTPTRVWLKDEMYDWAVDILDTSAAGDLLDLGYAKRLLEAHRRGEFDHSRKVWTVLVFCVWHAIFVTGSLDPRPTPAESQLLTKPVIGSLVS